MSSMKFINHFHYYLIVFKNRLNLETRSYSLCMNLEDSISQKHLVLWISCVLVHMPTRKWELVHLLLIFCIFLQLLGFSKNLWRNDELQQLKSLYQLKEILLATLRNQRQNFNRLRFFIYKYRLDWKICQCQQ